MKVEKKYGMIQIDSDVHKLLKEYCNKHGFKINGLVSKLIKDQIKKKL